MDSQGYGFHPLHYGTNQANNPYAAASTSTQNFYPGVTYPPVGAIPTAVQGHTQLHQAQTSSSAVLPAAVSTAQQLNASIPPSLFFNVGSAPSQLLDVFPTPSGTRHKTFFEESGTREQADKLLSGPSAALVESITDLLSQTATHPVTFKNPDGSENHLLNSSTASVLKVPSPSSLQRQIQELEPTVLILNSTAVRRSFRKNASKTGAPPGVENMGAVYGTSETTLLPVVNPENNIAPESISSHAPPPIKIKLSTKFAKASASTEPVQKKMRSSPPVGPSPELLPSSHQPNKIVVVLPVTKKDKHMKRVRDENRIDVDYPPASPEIPIKPPQVPKQRVEELKPEEKSDPLCASGDVFDPSQLTIKISRVSVETAVDAYYDAINNVCNSPTPYPRKSSAARRAEVPSQSNDWKKANIAGAPSSSLDSSGEKLTLQSFNRTAEKVLDRVSQCDISHLVIGNPDVEITDADIPSEAVLSSQLSRKLVEDAAKLKAHDLTRHVAIDVLKNLLVALLPTILHGYIIPSDMQSLMQDGDDSEFRESFNSRFLRGAEATVSALSIMTSPKMPKEIFNPDVLQPCIRFATHHLHDTIYPAFDPLYSCQAQAKDGFVSKIKQKRARAGASKDDAMLKLYSRFEDIALLFADVVSSQPLDEAPLYSLASLGVSAFFVENVRDLQLKSLRLVANIFAKYEKHREVICEDILSSLAKLPSSKRNLRNYVISAKGENIQMISALLLHLIQSIAKIPSKRQLAHRGDPKGADFETTILLSYDESTRCAKSILSAFFMKCAAKGDEDYRPLFENFIVDLLTTVNKPEWPAAESLLSILGVILLQKSNDKTLDANFRYASIDYLGLITSRMRKDSISIRDNPSQLQDLVTKFYQTFSMSDDGLLEVDTSDIPDETHLFQQGLLHYLWHSVPAPSFAATYSLVQWYHDAVNISTDSQQPDEDEPEYRRLAPSEREQNKNTILEFMKTAAEQTRRPITGAKQLVDTPSANLVARHFASKRQFATSFDHYFRRILGMASDNATQIRIRAIKSVSTIIDADGALMGRLDVKNCVESRMFDTSASIRETVIEMIGKYSVLNPQHLEQYHQVLLKRLMDTAPSVRKRAIKVLHDFCVEWPDNDLCAGICGNIIKRIGDEEGIKKLVYEVFQSTWFDPKGAKDPDVISKRVSQILEVLGMLDVESVPATDWFERMLKDLLKREADQKHMPVHQACKAIVDQIFKQLLNTDSESEKAGEEALDTSKALLALSLLANCLPEVVMPHAQSLPPYLNQPLRLGSDQKVVSLTANILTIVVPLMKNPPDLFLAQIEESCVALFIKQGVNIQLLQDNVECLAAVVNHVTLNYKIVRDLYERFWKILVDAASHFREDNQNLMRINRALCIVALVVQHFDIESEAFGYVSSNIKDRLVDVFLALLKHPNPTVQCKSLQSLGFIFIRKPETMMQNKIASIYAAMLNPNNDNVDMKQIVLANLVRYVEHEESLIADIEEHTTAQEQYANLDLRGNQTSTAELPRKIIYHYLKSILLCGLDAEMDIRREVLNLISAVVRLRFSNPQLLIPYLMAAATEPYELQSTKAELLLEEINRKYHGALSTKALDGVKESFSFQKAIKSSVNSVVRGFRTGGQSGQPASLIGTVYSLLRPDRGHRRMLITSLLGTFRFEDSRLEQLLYFADNIAYFAYQTQDEPLFVMHQIDPIMAMICPDALHRFRKAFRLAVPQENCPDEDVYDEEELETPENLRRSLTGDLAELRRCYRLCQPSFLLIGLKKFLADYYGFGAAKLKEYSPNEKQAVWEKPIVSRKQAFKFAPGIVVEFVSKELKGTLEEFLTADLLVKKFLDFKTVVSTIDEVAVEPELGRSVEDDEEDFDDSELPSDEPSCSGVSAPPSGVSSDSSSPTKKRGNDAAFKKPRTPKKKPDPGTPKRPRGRPRKTPVKKAGGSSDEEDDSYLL